MNDFTPMYFLEQHNQMQANLVQAETTMLSMLQTIEAQKKHIETLERQIEFLSKYIENHVEGGMTDES